jgi:chromatin segregation and condensation protein Rec8/ScpA/Scc1 (kleisin family)
MLVELMRSLRALPESGSVNLNREIMRGRPRREAAQLLFNALVLASHDRVTLAQERPYGELYMARGGMFV